MDICSFCSICLHVLSLAQTLTCLHEQIQEDALYLAKRELSTMVERPLFSEQVSQLLSANCIFSVYILLMV